MGGAAVCPPDFGFRVAGGGGPPAGWQIVYKSRHGEVFCEGRRLAPPLRGGAGKSKCRCLPKFAGGGMPAPGQNRNKNGMPAHHLR
jgi:hypothetical protein